MTSQMDFDVAEFEREAAAHLGNANGNVYYRKPGIPKENDGQVMVRLKKKRFVVLDYTIQPNETDMATANGVAHMEIPSGAGKTQCITKECTKVGVPVKLYDSNPEDTVSLYLRSGLCFECQRNLNEKRRVDRKRKPDGPTLLYSLTGPNQKKFKVHGGDVIELKDDAIIVNGSMRGVKLAADGHSYQDIAVDLQDILRESTFEAERLLSSAADPMADIHSMYEKAFVAMNKAIFLMSQWKAAYDASGPVVDPHHHHHHHPHHHHHHHTSVEQAAVDHVVDQSDPHNGQQLVSLLLAADKDQQNELPHHDVQDPPDVHVKTDDEEVVDEPEPDPDHDVSAVDAFMEV